MSPGRWGAGHARHHASPVEMRFVDLFMAAMGALIFMAMLLAYLLPGLDHGDDRPPPVPPGREAFAIVTRELPPATVGAAYRVPLAYRGGTPPVRWQVVGAQEIPRGLRFDAGAGELGGTPARRSTGRFVVRATDAAGASATQPLLLDVRPSAVRRAGVVGRWFAIAVFVFFTLLLLMSLAAANVGRALVEQLEIAHLRQERTYELQTGPGVVEIIDLPGGIDTYRERLATTRVMSGILLVVIAALGVWIAWRYWLA